MTIKVGNLAARMVSSAHRHAKPLGAENLGHWRDHKHEWERGRGVERKCKKCGATQTNYDGVWL